MVSGGVADPLNTGDAESPSPQDCGSVEMESGGMADPLLTKESKPEQKEDGSPAVAKLQSKAGEIISALHQAKQELAAELEANLKQLKSVLQETQRIAKEMEAVLREAKAEPDPQQMTRGGQGDERGHEPKAPQQAKSKGNDDDESPDWDPPFVKKNGAQNSDEGWEPPKDAVEVYKN